MVIANLTLSLSKTCIMGIMYNGDSYRFNYHFNFPSQHFVVFFRGRPIGNGLTRRPSIFSSLLTKLSEPSGLPVCVLKRILVICASSIPPANSLRHCFAEIILYQFVKLSNSAPAASSTCAALLDHSYFHGRRQTLARTGFNSTYFAASQKPRSSTAHE